MGSRRDAILRDVPAAPVLPSASRMRRLAAANRAELQRADRACTADVARRQFDALNEFAETLAPSQRQAFLDLYSDAVRALDAAHRTKLQQLDLPAANSHAVSQLVLGVVSALAIYVVIRCALS